MRYDGFKQKQWSLLDFITKERMYLDNGLNSFNLKISTLSLILQHFSTFTTLVPIKHSSAQSNPYNTNNQ